MTGEDWSVLGYEYGEPVPGDPVVVRELAAAAQRTSEVWQEHTTTLRDAARYGIEMPMEGDFAATYRNRLGKLPDGGAALVTAHQDAGAALAQYAVQLEAAKRAALLALRQGIQAKEEAAQAKRMLAQVQAEMAALPKVVPPEQYPYVLQQFRMLQAQANQAVEWFDAAKMQWQQAQQDAELASEQAKQAETLCARTVLQAAPRSSAAASAPAAGGAVLASTGGVRAPSEGADAASTRIRPPRDGDTNYVVEDPDAISNTITDIDRIDDGTLWEEKTATGADPRMDHQVWIQRHIFGKLDSYVRARQYMPGYENAPLGLDFTRPGATAEFKSAVEQAIDQWKALNPGVNVTVRWAS